MARIAWTPELDAELIGSWASGMSWKDIAQEFNSTEYAVKARHKKLKQSAKAAKPTTDEPVHTPEAEPEARTDYLDKSAALHMLMNTIIGLAGVTRFTPDHIVLDCNNGVLTAMASGNDSDGRCVELTLTRHTLQA